MAGRAALPQQSRAAHVPARYEGSAASSPTMVPSSCPAALATATRWQAPRSARQGCGGQRGGGTGQQGAARGTDCRAPQARRPHSEESTPAQAQGASRATAHLAAGGADAAGGRAAAAPRVGAHPQRVSVPRLLHRLLGPRQALGRLGLHRLLQQHGAWCPQHGGGGLGLENAWRVCMQAGKYCPSSQPASPLPAPQRTCILLRRSRSAFRCSSVTACALPLVRPLGLLPRRCLPPSALQAKAGGCAGGGRRRQAGRRSRHSARQQQAGHRTGGHLSQPCARTPELLQQRGELGPHQLARPPVLGEREVEAGLGRLHACVVSSRGGGIRPSARAHTGAAHSRPHACPAAHHEVQGLQAWQVASPWAPGWR